MTSYITFNVSGLRNKKKCQITFNWLKRKNCDIALLQEVYCNQNDISEWTKEWEGQIFSNHGTNRSKGVSILINPQSDVEGKQFFADKEGRLLVVKVEIEHETINIWNICAPNDLQDRKKFLEFLKKSILEQGINGKNVFGGDFNTVLNPSLDKIGGCNNTQSAAGCVSKIEEILNTFSLIDIWRKKHGKKKSFTWSRKSSKVKSTLDYWFIPCVFENFVEQIEIIPGFGSDHMAVEMVLQIHGQEKGHGYWKLNNSLLENQNYNEGIERLVNDTINECNNVLNARQTWDLCKNRIRSFSINFAKAIKKENDSKMSDLEKSLKMAFEKILSDPTNINLVQEYEKVKLEYELLYHHYMKGLIIRSKAKWTEEGEKCSKYFMNLEKRNFSKKSITDLIDTDGNVVKNQEELINLQVQYYKDLYKKNDATLRHSYKSFVENVDIKELSPENKESCEGLLDINECKVSLDKMANNKSPGCDGLTAEFYKHHWNLVGQLVVNSFNEAYENNELSSSHKCGIITLIHKGKGLPEIILIIGDLLHF